MTDQDNAPAHMNGPPTAAASIDAQLEQALSLPVIMLLRGALTSIQGPPADKIISAICRQLGRAVGISFGFGDLAPLLRARADCKEAFAAGMKEIPMKPMPLVQQPGAPPSQG